MKGFQFSFLLTAILSFFAFVDAVDAQDTSTTSDSEETVSTPHNFSNTPPGSIANVPKTSLKNQKPGFIDSPNIKLFHLPMKIFIPDRALTSTMPILNPGPVDQGILIPEFERLKPSFKSTAK